MKLYEILPKLVNKECKYIQSESLVMYNQKIKSIKLWLFADDCRYFRQMTEATDWEVQHKLLGKI